ncbi:MAG TPA: Gfo/Idh/MocA family oxidoreductase [Stellaceae bacterium]|nr:Gfo/Idh/MocA family oxidoreductase [Stellaceae bacterium]
MRGAFIGFGNVAEQGHLPGWRTRGGVAMVAATDPAASRRGAFLAACPDGRWYDTADALLAGEAPDFVDICAPPGSHAALIHRALDAGLHVLCEKPLVTRAPDALAVVEAAAQAGRIVHTVHNWLEAPICRRVSALIAERAIGAVRSIEWQTLRTRPASAADGGSNWRVDPVIAGGGILFDHGWHALYCVMRWAGGAPGSVTATLETRRFHQWPIEDTATLELQHRAVAARIHLTWAADERANRLVVEGERGRIHVAGEFVVAELMSGERRFHCPPALSEGSHHPDWFAGVAEDFLAAASGSGASNLAEAVLCGRIIDLAQRSSAAGGARLSLG